MRCVTCKQQNHHRQALYRAHQRIRPSAGSGARERARQLKRISSLVPRRGLEPPRLSPLVPETSASTNSATWASGATDIGFRVSPCQSFAAHDPARKPLATFRDHALEAAAFRAITRSPRCAHKAHPMTEIPTETLVTVFGG